MQLGCAEEKDWDIYVGMRKTLLEYHHMSWAKVTGWYCRDRTCCSSEDLMLDMGTQFRVKSLGSAFWCQKYRGRTICSGFLMLQHCFGRAGRSPVSPKDVHGQKSSRRTQTHQLLLGKSKSSRSLTGAKGKNYTENKEISWWRIGKVARKKRTSWWNRHLKVSSHPSCQCPGWNVCVAPKFAMTWRQKRGSHHVSSNGALVSANSLPIQCAHFLF